MDFQKTPKAFNFFWHYATYRRLEKIWKKISKIFSHFFHYFDIVRLLLDKINFPQRFRLRFFWIFAAEWMFKNTKRSPFQFFRNWDFFHFFSLKCPPSIFFVRREEKCQSVPLVRQSCPTFGFLGCFRREHFEVFLLFLSLRDGADLGRSRLV